MNILNPFYKSKLINNKCVIIDKMTNKQILVYNKGDYMQMLSNGKIVNYLKECDVLLPLSKYTIYESMFKQLEYMDVKIDQTILSRVLKIRLKGLCIRIINLCTDYNSSALSDTFDLFNGTDHGFYIIVYHNISDLIKVELEKVKGVVCLFKVDDNKINIIGPFFTIDNEMPFLNENNINYIQKSQIIKTVIDQEGYFQRENSEVISNAVLSSIFDYFSEYITNECPFLDRKIGINENKIDIYEKYFYKE